MSKQPTFQNMIEQFHQNDFIEIGYITGIKRFYKSSIVTVK